MRGDAVWVAADCSYPDEGDYWRTRLGDAMAHDLDLVTREGGARPARSIRCETPISSPTPSCSARGIVTTGAPVPRFWPRWRTCCRPLDEDDRYLALFKGISEVAGDCAGEMPRRDRKPLADARAACGHHCGTGSGTGPWCATEMARSAPCSPRSPPVRRPRSSPRS